MIKIIIAFKYVYIKEIMIYIRPFILIIIPD